MYDICIRTAAAGGDATGTYADDSILPDIFAGPYAELEPGLAFVVDGGEGAVGYIVGAADTAAFAERFRTEWLPRLGDRHPEAADPPVTPTDLMTKVLRHPERMVLPELAEYPAHLHIDLLPSHQRAGYGRELMWRLLGELSGRGVKAVHLGMLTANTPARAFYDRLGFHEIPVPGAGELTYLGRSTTV